MDHCQSLAARIAGHRQDSVSVCSDPRVPSALTGGSVSRSVKPSLLAGSPASTSCTETASPCVPSRLAGASAASVDVASGDSVGRAPACIHAQLITSQECLNIHHKAQQMGGCHSGQRCMHGATLCHLPVPRCLTSCNSACAASHVKCSRSREGGLTGGSNARAGRDGAM